MENNFVLFDDKIYNEFKLLLRDLRKKESEEILETLKSCEILHINENDYTENKEETVRNCIEFLFSEARDKI